MQRIGVWGSAVMTALVLSGTALAQDGGIRAEVAAANAAYDAAILARDAAALDALFAPDFVYVGTHANRRDRTEQIRNMTAGEGRLVEGRSEEVEITPLGDAAALVTGRFVGVWREDGADEAVDERYTTVWVRTDGRWRLKHEHVSLRPAQR